jgi:hypothetical protein
MPALYLVPRSNSSSSSTFTIQSPIIIAGLTIIILIFCGVSSWLGFRIYQKRAAAKRESRMGAAFLSVKGVVVDGPGNEKGVHPSTDGFSRHKIDSTVILPQKALINSAVSRSALPRPFTRTPSPSAGVRLADVNHIGPRELPQSRNSFMSTNSYSHFSFMSATSTISTTSGTTRKVRQRFEPVLPDELLPVLGERLTVVRSFDDGWCVVGRENSTFAHSAKSLFKSQEPGDHIEIGVVPAWCFLKQVKGLRAERPIRSSSLGVTVNMDGPSSRNELISWSNF